MSVTLYGVLGVAPDCDSDAIERAYRQQVKEHHPDVSDAADAGDRFRRLTTAKEVLTDETERARYDRVGHERYVRRHLDDSWRGGAAERAAGATGDGASAAEAARQVRKETTNTTTEPRQAQRVDRSDGYATASDYYRPGQRVGVQSSGALGGTLAAVRDVLPWLLAHLTLLGGAVTMAAMLITSAGGVPSITTLVVAAVMVGATAGVSVLHLSAALFR